MASPLLPVRRFWLVAALMLAAISPAFAAEEKEELVPATNLPSRTDGRGHVWRFQRPAGAVMPEGSSILSLGAQLLLDGNEPIFGNPMMTPDGQEAVFRGTYSAFRVTRRARLDEKNAVMRYLEVIENLGPAEASAELTIRTTMTGSAQRLIDSSGQPMKEDADFSGGFAAVPLSSSRAGLVFYNSAGRPGAPVTVTNRGNQQIEFTQTLKLPAGGTRVVMHTLAQRRGVTGEDVAAVQKLFTEPAFLASIPKKYLALLKASGDPSAAGPRLEALEVIADSLKLQRDELDHLALDPQTQLTGSVTCGDLQVETAFGKAAVPFAEVAGVSGGAGVGRSVRIFLRNGEIVSGAMAKPDCAMQTDSGLKVTVDFGAIDLLLCRKSERDSAPDTASTLLITTQLGDSLAVAAPDAVVEAATPFGPLRVPIMEVKGLEYVRTPFPAYRLSLLDGTRVLAMLRGDAWTLTNQRFGTVKLVPQEVSQLRQMRALEKESKSVKGPHFELTGENVLAGTLDMRELPLKSASGTIPIEVAKIRSLKPDGSSEEGAQRVWKVQLVGGEELSGQLTDRVLRIRARDQVWRLPLQHVASYTGGETASGTAKNAGRAQ